MRLRTLHTVCRFRPYVVPNIKRLTAASAGEARPLATLVHRAVATPEAPRLLLETAVAAWPDILTVPPPGSDAPDPPTWAAWSTLFVQLLAEAARTQNLVGLDVWMADVQRAQLARTYAPPQDDAPLSVLACRMGAHAGSPRSFNVVRRLLELREALWCAAQLPPDGFIDVGCDQTKWQMGLGAPLPSSDLAICGSDGQVLRRIEVTSLHKPAEGPEALRRGLTHVLRKAVAEDDGALHEGCIAVYWAQGVQPRASLEVIRDRLNKPAEQAPIYRKAAQTLHSVTFVDYRPTRSPRVWGRLQKHPHGWVVETELRLEQRCPTRRLSTGGVGSFETDL